MAEEERIQLSIHPDAFWYAKKPILGKPYIRLSAFCKGSYVELKYDDEKAWREDIAKFRKLAIFINQKIGIEYITRPEVEYIKSCRFQIYNYLIEGDLEIKEVIPDLRVEIKHNPGKYDICHKYNEKIFCKYIVTICFDTQVINISGLNNRDSYETTQIKLSQKDARLLKLLLRAKFITNLSLITRTVNFNCLYMRRAIDDALSTGSLKML